MESPRRQRADADELHGHGSTPHGSQRRRLRRAERGEAQIGPGDANAPPTPMPALCCPLRRELRRH
jgi:hypothetical protein